MIFGSSVVSWVMWETRSFDESYTFEWENILYIYVFVFKSVKSEQNGFIFSQIETV